jgi:iron complex transport system ATP-binding protein
VVAAGPVEEVVTKDVLSATFGMPLVLQRTDGRFHARRRTPHRALEG